MATVKNDGIVSFTVKNIVKKELLNYASLGENSNKFYRLELQEGGPGSQHPYRIYTEYGRLGKTPRKENRFYTDLSSAEADFRSILSQKRSKGYEPVQVDDGANSSQTITLQSKTKKEDLNQINDNVLRLIGKLYKEATSYIVSAISTPLGKLNPDQIKRGLEILQKIEQMLDDGLKSGGEFDRLSNQFYSVIPVIFGTKVDYKKFIINDYIKLNERKDLLGVMSSVVQAQNTLEKTLDEKYKSLKIKLKSLSSRTKEYKRICDSIKNSQGHNHHFKIDVQEIFQIEDMVGHDTFNPYQVGVKELFHGSRNENILSIMQNSLKIKPASAVHTGSMFGSGIYFANSASKSANYCWGFDSRSRQDTYYLFVCDVATGKIKEYGDAQPYLTSAPKGYNSVMGKKGRSLIHDEFIVYHESQVKLKYIVEFAKKY